MHLYMFDLDGVLADSRPGLYLSFRAALTAIGMADLADRDLERFLGAPLPEMFRVLRPDIGPEEIARGIAAFRAGYEDTGIRHNVPYPGIDEMLRAVVQRKSAAWLVTLKPEIYAIKVAAMLGIDRYLGGICGAGLEETDTKAGLIARALAQAGVVSGEAVMLGDRHHDITGALANHVLPVGALWGYGSRAELHEAGCLDFVRSPDEFRKSFIENPDAAAMAARRSLV